MASPVPESSEGGPTPCHPSILLSVAASTLFLARSLREKWGFSPFRRLRGALNDVRPTNPKQHHRVVCFLLQLRQNAHNRRRNAAPPCDIKSCGTKKGTP